MGRRPGPEKEFQARLQSALQARGYLVDHTYKLKCQDGSWRTGSTLTGKPDLLGLRPPRLVAIEVKSATGRVEPRQQAVLSYWAAIPNARAWVLRPTDDWDTVMGWLDRVEVAPRVHGFDRLPVLDAYRVVAPASARKAR